VELETETGATLQLAEGKPAIIKMKVPSSLVAAAPAQIPLWHFSETDGLWREQGLATLNNGWYSGTYRISRHGITTILQRLCL
jgi:hypothetical protein